MELAMADNEKVLESLRDTVEKDANRMASLKERVNFLEEEAKKKDDASVDLGAKLTKVEQVFADIAGWADAVYIEYKKALAVLGFEPLPLPEPAEGGEGVLRLMNWLVSEFEGLGEIMDVASDNAASLFCEGLLGHQVRGGCTDLAKLAEDDFTFVPYGDLSGEVLGVQPVKAAFFEKFWYTSRKEAVRDLAAAQLEVT